jgi:hypothetical protein
VFRRLLDTIRRWFAAPTVTGDPQKRDADWPSRAAYDDYDQFGGPK